MSWKVNGFGDLRPIPCTSLALPDLRDDGAVKTGQPARWRASPRVTAIKTSRRNLESPCRDAVRRLARPHVTEACTLSWNLPAISE